MKKPRYLVMGWNPVSNAGQGPHMKSMASPTLKAARKMARDYFGSCEDVSIYEVGRKYEEV